MSDRENSPAYATLPKSARRVLAAIEDAIGCGSSVALSHTALRLDYHFGRQTLSPALKFPDSLGMVDISPDKRLVNVFRRAPAPSAIECWEGAPQRPRPNAGARSLARCGRALFLAPDRGGYFAMRNFASDWPMELNTDKVWLACLTSKNLSAPLAQYFSTVEVGSPPVLT